MSREDIDLVANSEDAVRIILLILQNYSATYVDIGIDIFMYIIVLNSCIS